MSSWLEVEDAQLVAGVGPRRQLARNFDGPCGISRTTADRRSQNGLAVIAWRLNRREPHLRRGKKPIKDVRAIKIKAARLEASRAATRADRSRKRGKKGLHHLRRVLRREAQERNHLVLGFTAAGEVRKRVGRR